MARWVTIRPDAFPFNYRAPSGAWLHFKADQLDASGERLVPDDQADFIIARGYGKEGKAAGSKTRSSKGGKRRVTAKGKTARAKAAKMPANATAPDTGPDPSLVDAPLVAAGSPDDRDRVDQTAG